MNRKLTDYIEASRGRKFDWDTANCAHFAGAWVQIAEGFDPLGGLADFAGSKPEADLRISTIGGLSEATDRALKRQPIHPNHAQAGDVVFLRLKSGLQMLGICEGRRAAIAAEPDGLIFVGMEFAISAWPIGRAA